MVRISLTQQRQDTIVPVTSRSTNPKTWLANLCRLVYGAETKQIHSIDYTTGGTSATELASAGPMFCDNIVLYYPISPVEDRQELHNKQRALLAAHTFHITNVFNTLELPIAKSNITTIPSECLDCCIQQLKVDMSSIPLDALLSKWDVLITTLAKDDIYVHDIDITRDYAGVVDMAHLREHLQYMDDIVLLDNQDKVGNNCVSFMRTTEEDIRCRYKYYNKFIQSVESPGVRKKVGSHLIHWSNNPEPPLKEAISKTQQTGILRLEYTLYNDNAVYAPTPKQTIPQIHFTRELVTVNMEWLANTLPISLLYHNSIQNQWHLLQDSTCYNLCLVDVETNVVLIAWWCNTLTGKIQGYYIEDATEDYITNLVKLYTTSLPTIVLLCKTQLLHNKPVLVIQQDTYSTTPHTTFLTNGKPAFAQALASIDVTTMGLVDTPQLTLRTTDKRYNLRTKNPDKIDVSITQLDHPLLAFFTNTTGEQTEAKDYSEEYKAFMDGIQRFRVLCEQMEQRKRLRDAVNMVNTKPITLEPDKEVYVYGYCIDVFGVIKHPELVVASYDKDATNHFFRIKVGSDIYNALIPSLIGYGPLLSIRFVKNVPYRNTTKPLYQIVEDLQSDYNTTPQNQNQTTTPVVGSIVVVKALGRNMFQLTNGESIKGCCESMLEKDNIYTVLVGPYIDKQHGYLLVLPEELAMLEETAMDEEAENPLNNLTLDSYPLFLQALTVCPFLNHVEETIQHIQESDLLLAKAKQANTEKTEEEVIKELLDNITSSSSTNGLDLPDSTKLLVVGIATHKNKSLLLARTEDQQYISIKPNKTVQTYITENQLTGVSSKGFFTMTKVKNGYGATRNKEVVWMLPNTKLEEPTSYPPIDQITNTDQTLTITSYTKWRNSYLITCCIGEADCKATSTYYLTKLLKSKPTTPLEIEVGDYKTTPSHNKCREYSIV